MSDLDDLITALCAGDPSESVDLPTVQAMAEAALSAGWRPSTFYGAGAFTITITDRDVPTIVTDPMFPVPEGPDDGR